MMSKNAKASLIRNEFENLKKQRVYAKENDPSKCPVVAYKMYHDKIQNCKIASLFPKPCTDKKKLSRNGEWYSSARPLGKNTLDTLMVTLSEAANLSKRYTNHCLRVTAITVLKENGASNEEIAPFSGHKNPGSVQRYCRKRKDECFQSFSDQLTDGFQKSCVKVEKFQKRGQIEINKEVISNTSADKIAVSVHFNGHFQNCSFSIN